MFDSPLNPKEPFWMTSEKGTAINNFDELLLTRDLGQHGENSIVVFKYRACLHELCWPVTQASFLSIFHAPI